NEFRIGRNGRLRRCSQNEGHGLDAADGDEILDRIVRQRLEHRRPGGDGAGRAEEQGVAVRGRLRHRRAADRPRGAGAVVDDDLLPERFAEGRRYRARGDVDIAARRPRHHDTHRVRREFLSLHEQRARERGQCNQRFHSGFAPEMRTISAYFTTSVRRSLANSSGVLPTGSAPCSTSRCFVSGERAARAVALPSVVTISRGAAAGARSAYHTGTSTPSTPASFKVGTSGMRSDRCGPATARARRRPLLTWPRMAGTLAKLNCTSPATTAVSEAAVPL